MNIICIVSDSLRRDHLGCYGNRWIHTPNLDKFAKESCIMQDAYQSSHPTLPNRTDNFTGRYCFPWRGWAPLPKDDLVISEWLGSNGYDTMIVGDTYHMFKEDFYYYRGFDAWDWIRGQEGDRLVMDATIPIEFPCAGHKIRQPYPDRYPQIIRNRYHRRFEGDWMAPQVYTHACNWLDNNHMRDRFFLWIDGFDPHEPWDPPQHYIDLYDPGYKGEVCDNPEGDKCDFLTKRELKHTRARYAAEVTMVDKWFGHLMARLEDMQLLDDTAIFYMADHGHYLNYPGDGGLIGKPLGGKTGAFPMYRSLANIPMLVRLPGGKGGGRKVKGVVQPPDLLPTVADLLKLEKPKDLHGQSYLPLLKGRKQDRRPFAVTASHRNQATVNHSRWSCSIWHGTRPAALFDVSKDPNMERDIAKKNPAQVRRMHKELVEFVEGLGAPDGFAESYDPMI